MASPVEFNQDVAPEDDLLENSNLDAYPSQISDHGNSTLLIPGIRTSKIYSKVPWVGFVPTF